MNTVRTVGALTSVLRELRPNVIVHFAEQRAAPYSMRSPVTKRYTVDNNVRPAHNLLTALVHTRVNAAIAHLSTMGGYGYGYVLNRFLMQAAIGHPLTVHGTGGQTRAFIHIKDTAACVEIAISHPPKKGERPCADDLLPAQVSLGGPGFT